MKKLFITLFVAALAFGSSAVLAAGGKVGASSRTLEAGSPGVAGSPFETPRGSGIEAVEDREENENFAHGDEAPAEQAQGAWSKQEGK